MERLLLNRLTFAILVAANCLALFFPLGVAILTCIALTQGELDGEAFIIWMAIITLGTVQAVALWFALTRIQLGDKRSYLLLLFPLVVWLIIIASIMMTSQSHHADPL